MVKLELDTLETWLWDSADILRGSIDSSDFKNYIFGLLFLKRANDVFHELVEAIMADEKMSREEAEEECYFKVPPNARWSNLTSKTENIGEAIDKAFAEIEAANTYLQGVLSATRFGDKEKLSDELLQRLLKHFNKYSLRNADLYKPDLLGDAYEYLIKQFADDAGKKGGEFYTPKAVVQLIVRLIDPRPGHHIYDPTCGSGGMLIEAARYVKGLDGGLKGRNIDISLAGQEKNLGTWAICVMNLWMHGLDDHIPSIRKGDTLTQPQHLNGETDLRLFDRVIANPPFSQNKWWTTAETSVETYTDRNGKEKTKSPNYNKQVVDQFGRFQYGIPPRGYADMAFLQHMIASLRADGRMGVVLPHGTLFRSGAEGRIRKKLLERDLVEGIVGLPAALFYNTGIPASVWIINRNKPAALKNKLLIMDASSDYKEGKNQNELLPGHLDKIVDAYRERADVDKYMRVVDIAEIAENDHNLNISRYIDTSEPEPEVDLMAVRGRIAELQQAEAEIDARLEGFLNELGV